MSMITIRERTLVSCLMAVSNMGMLIDEQMLTDMVLSYTKGHITNDLINVIASPYMADINPKDAFEQEASSWFINLHGKTWDAMFQIWPHHTRYFRLIRDSDPSRQT